MAKKIQVNLQGFTPIFIPRMNNECIAYKDDGWHLIFKLNHWPTMYTCKNFVNNILLNYCTPHINLLGFLTHQYMIWFLGSLRIHINLNLRQ